MKFTFAAKTFAARSFRCATFAGPVTIKVYRLANAQAACSGAVAGDKFHTGATIGQDFHTGATAGACHG